MPKYDPSTSINKEGFGTMIFTGDFSRYNGNINVKEGTAAFTNSKEMEFAGGSVKLCEGSILELDYGAQPANQQDLSQSLKGHASPVVRSLKTKNDSTIQFLLDK